MNVRAKGYISKDNVIQDKPTRNTTHVIYKVFSYEDPAHTREDFLKKVDITDDIFSEEYIAKIFESKKDGISLVEELNVDGLINKPLSAGKIVTLCGKYDVKPYKRVISHSGNKDLRFKIEDKLYTMRQIYKPVDGVNLKDLQELDTEGIGIYIELDLSQDFKEGDLLQIDEAAAERINSHRDESSTKVFSMLKDVTPKAKKKKKNFVNLQIKDLLQ